MARWDKAGIPHKGWTEIGMVDLGEETEPGEDIQYEQCEMCGNEKIRYEMPPRTQFSMLKKPVVSIKRGKLTFNKEKETLRI